MKTRDWGGEERWISVDGRPRHDAQGRFQGYCGVGRDVTQRVREEEARNRQREVLLQAQKLARLGRWEWDIPADAYWASDEVLRMFDIERREGLGREDFLRVIHHDDRDKVQAALDAALQRDVPYSIVYRVFRADGTARTVHSEAQLSRDDAGRPLRLVGTCQDISARVAAEQALRDSEARIRNLNIDLERRVEERTRQLAAANDELEAFSYSVSHDLQAPLRRIERYVELLAQTNGARLDDSGRDMLARMRTASVHTKRLIEDMLKLAKISRADVAFSSVDLSAMAAGILEQLDAHASPPRRTEVYIDPGMSVHADPAMLHILLDNLLGNAWKFTGRTPQPRISVARLDGAAGFAIRDNGAGFDMRYAQKLFGAFQRLHGQEEFQGSGIGLAIVQRIVNLHGWRIEAAAEPGKGATFTVSTK
jgi:PAS domain S-box-containing protein